MIDFLKLCDFQAGFGFIAFFSGFISFICFSFVYSAQFSNEVTTRTTVLKYAKIFLYIMMISVFLVAVLPAKEELTQLITK